MGDCSCADVDVRRCRFIDVAVPPDVVPLARLVGESRDKFDGTMLVVDDLGRFEDDAIFGSAAPALRDAL